MSPTRMVRHPNDGGGTTMRSCVDGRSPSGVCSMEVATTVHPKQRKSCYDSTSVALFLRICPISIHALERSLVHTSVFLHTMCAPFACEFLLLIEHSTAGIIIPSPERGSRSTLVHSFQSSLTQPGHLDMDVSFMNVARL